MKPLFETWPDIHFFLTSTWFSHFLCSFLKKCQTKIPNTSKNSQGRLNPTSTWPVIWTSSIATCCFSTLTWCWVYRTVVVFLATVEAKNSIFQDGYYRERSDRLAGFSLSLSAVCLLSVCWSSSKVTRAIRFVKPKECHYVIKKLPLKPGSRWAIWICKFSAHPGSRNMSSKVIEKRVFDGAWIKTSFSTSSEPGKIHVPSRSWIRQMPIWCRWES